MKLFELFATLGLDTSEFDRGTDEAVRKGETLGAKVTNSIGSKAVFWGNILNDFVQKSVSTLTEIAIQSLNVGAEMEAANAQFEAAFGGLQGVATAAFEAIGKEINVLPSRLKEVGTKGFSQLKGSGMSANEALENTQRLMRLAADAAAYYDISLEAADERIRSFLRGNTEAGDAIGLFTSESQRNSAALETYGKKWIDLTEAQKQVLMLNIAEEIYQQAGAIGQAERESDSWTNTLANLKEAWRLIVGRFGLPFTDALTPILEKITTFLTENQDDVETFATSVAGLVETGLNKLIEAFQWCLDNQEKLETMLLIAAGAFVAIKVAVDPVGTAILGIGIAAATLVANWETVKATLVGIWNDVKTAVENAIAAVRNFFSLSADASSRNVSMVQSAVDSGRSPSFLESWADAMIQNQSSWFPGRSSGMSYVPYDDYGVFLHRGEAVLTRQQAEEYRASQSGSGADTAALLAEIRALGDRIERMSINMDGKHVGDVVTERVSQNIAKKTKTMRGYAT